MNNNFFFLIMLLFQNKKQKVELASPVDKENHLLTNEKHYTTRRQADAKLVAIPTYDVDTPTDIKIKKKRLRQWHRE